MFGIPVNMDTSRKSKIMFERDNCVDVDAIVIEIYPTKTRSIAIKISKDKDDMCKNNVQQYKGYMWPRYT